MSCVYLNWNLDDVRNKQIEKDEAKENENILSAVYIFSTYLNAFPASWSISQLCVYIGLERWPNEHVPRLMDSFRPVDLCMYTSSFKKKQNSTRKNKEKENVFRYLLEIRQAIILG